MHLYVPVSTWLLVLGDIRKYCPRLQMSFLRNDYFNLETDLLHLARKGHQNRCTENYRKRIFPCSLILSQVYNDRWCMLKTYKFVNATNLKNITKKCKKKKFVKCMNGISFSYVHESVNVVQINLLLLRVIILKEITFFLSIMNTQTTTHVHFYFMEFLAEWTDGTQWVNNSHKVFFFFRS